MKRAMRVVTTSAGIVGVLAVAGLEAVAPTGVQAQQALRCLGDSEPVCATLKSCRGLWWFKQCVERSLYWDLAPPPGPVG